MPGAKRASLFCCSCQYATAGVTALSRGIMTKRQYKVLVITSIEVEALDAAEAIEKAYESFDSVKIDDFEFQVEEWD